MPTVEAPPQKRRRCNEDDATVLTEPIRAVPVTRSEIWFDDGSVILEAEAIQFRVHSSMLARHSTIFKDLFSIPQPQNEPTIEGCPIVHLSDSAEDIKHLLLALYDRTYNTREPIPYAAIAAMLRMGRKYDFENLRDEALLRLTSEFPTTLNEWEKLPPDYTQIVEQKGLSFDIVTLAHENGIQSILPAAYYLCIQDLDSIFDGEKREDGSISHLPHNIKRICVLGREKLLNALPLETLCWLDGEEVSDDCESPEYCLRRCTNTMAAVWKPIPDPSHSLESWSNFVSNTEFLVCAKCMEAAKVHHNSGRQRMWNLLPSFFELPDWAELRNCED